MRDQQAYENTVRYLAYCKEGWGTDYCESLGFVSCCCVPWKGWLVMATAWGETQLAAEAESYKQLFDCVYDLQLKHKGEVNG